MCGNVCVGGVCGGAGWAIKIFILTDKFACMFVCTKSSMVGSDNLLACCFHLYSKILVRTGEVRHMAQRNHLHYY